MRALLITVVVSSVSGAVWAQTGSDGVRGLESCFQAAREADATCSSPGNDAAQRLDCFQKARASQLECLEQVAPRPAAEAPPTNEMSTGATARETPTPAAPSPVTAVAPPDQPAGPVPPEQTSNVPGPADPSANAARPDLPASTSAPDRLAGSSAPLASDADADGRAKQTDTDWVVSETTSPVDFTPLISAATRSLSGSDSLMISCRGQRTELRVRTTVGWRSPRSGEIQITYQINDQPAVTHPWAQSADGKTVSYREDAAGLLRSIPTGARVKITASEGPDSGHDASFQLAGLDTIQKKIGAVCKEKPATAKITGKTTLIQGGQKPLLTIGKPVTTVGHSSSPAPAVPSSVRRPTER